MYILHVDFGSTQDHRPPPKGRAGVPVYAVDGMADHVHVVASMPPAVALADFVGKVKGYCSVIAYVENQKRHRAGKTTIGILERAEGSPASDVREPATPYDLDDTRWRRELQALDDDTPGDDDPR